MVWLHASPSYIPDGEWVVSAAKRGGRSRTHPNGYGDSELRWYSPDRVYVFDSTGVEPRQHLGRFAFVRDDYYLYEVEPQELGPDLDVGARAMQSATCARARVVRCVHAPELPVVPADLGEVAGDGGQVVTAALAWPPGQQPQPGRRVVLRDAGLSMAGVVRQAREDGTLVVDVLGDTVRPVDR